jgi:GrpB-like predicted nucleotidyltransferase (UPF0157 family)
VRLKEGLAERFPRDVEAYTRHKTEFVEGVLRRVSPTPLRT